MFQKGTGERFKYKESVLVKFPDAVCKRTKQKSFNNAVNAHYLYAVYNNEKRISEATRTAENAWADCWCKYIKEPELKIKIELHVVGDGRTFLNFWNWKNGDDVTAELKSGKLYQKEKEITLQKFLDTVKGKF